MATIGQADKAKAVGVSSFYQLEGLAHLLKDDMKSAIVSLEAAVGLEPSDAGAREVLASALLAVELNADMLIMATDVDAVYRHWATPRAEAIRRATPDEMRQESFNAGSMAPKVEAACRFAELAGGTAAIGSLSELRGIVDGERGTSIALPSDPAAVRLPGL